MNIFKKFITWLFLGGFVLASGGAVLLSNQGITYEFLVRTEDKLTSKAGDCIAFKEEGWSWGKNEKKHFALLKIKDITFEKALELCSSGEATTTVYTIEGKPKTYQAKNYNFKINTMVEINDWLDKNKEVLPTIFDSKKVKLKK